MNLNMFVKSFIGTIGCIWYITWLIVVREGPHKDKFITKDELRYIQESLGTTDKQTIKHPWKDIFRSKAVYAICASHFAENWGFYTMLTQLPSFLKGQSLSRSFFPHHFVVSSNVTCFTDSLGYKLEKAGFLAAAPYLAMGILLAISGYFADMCQIKGYLTTTQVRRYFNCGGSNKHPIHSSQWLIQTCVFTGFLAQTVFLMTAAFIMSPTAIIACIIIAIGLGAFAWCGFA